MSGRLVPFAALAVAFIALVGAEASGATVEVQTGVVASVYDGDTLTLNDGRRVRLLQIDTPELGSGECYSRAARNALLKLVPIGSRVQLEADARLDTVDRYGRLLRYVHRGPVNANTTLVRAGAAAPYFYGGDLGKYASGLLADASANEGRLPGRGRVPLVRVTHGAFASRPARLLRVTSSDCLAYTARKRLAVVIAGSAVNPGGERQPSPLPISVTGGPPAPAASWSNVRFMIDSV